MKYSLALASSLLTMTSALPTSLFPRQASTAAILTIKTGDGDSASTLSCTTDQVCVPQSNNANSVQTSVNEPNIYCAGFTDAGATQLINPIFNSAVPASYSASSNGGTGSVASDAITIGSYFCSANKASVQSRSSGATAGSSNTASSSSSSSSSSGMRVRIKLERYANTFVHAEIPLDAIPLANSPYLGSQGLHLSIVSATGFDVNKVGCQVFSDRAGTKPIDGIATFKNQLTLSKNPHAPAMIGAIACGVVQD